MLRSAQRQSGLSVAFSTAGFTVMELLVCLAIIALALTIVVPRTASGRNAAELRFVASSTLSLLRQIRSDAITKNREQIIVFDMARRRILERSTGRSMPLGSNTRVTLVALSRETDGAQRGALRFYPDGSSSGGRVIFSNGPHRIQLDIDWLTGVVRQTSRGSANAKGG